MSVPPDNFDEDGNPIEPDIPEQDIDDEFVAWRADSEPPEWFYSAANLLGELEDRDSVFLEIEGGMGAATRDEETGEYSLVIHAFDEDTNEDMYFSFDGWTKEDLLAFYDYTEDYYADVSFWSENYSLGNL